MDEFGVHTRRMAWRHVTKLEDEDDLLVEVNVQRKTCDREQNWNSATEEHAHVDQGQHLTVSPMPVEGEASMLAHVLID